MNLRNPTLWARIQAFEFDDSNATFPFSKKLAHQQGWSADFTQCVLKTLILATQKAPYLHF